MTDNEFREKALSFVKERRQPHVLGTAETAVKLARAFGADKHAAWRAALLHDCTKRFDHDEQLKFCEECGIILDQSDIASPAVIHAITGAEFARRNFDITEDEYNAILWHTTGRAGMSPLEKSVYLADVIEPTRTYELCVRAREIAETDANAALFTAATNTMLLLIEQKQPIHPKTIEMYNDLVGRR